MGGLIALYMRTSDENAEDTLKGGGQVEWEPAQR